MATETNTQDDGNSASQADQIGLEHVVYELRMLRTEMEQYYSMIFKAQEMMLTSWGDFFGLWMETVKHDRL